MGEDHVSESCIGVHIEYISEDQIRVNGEREFSEEGRD
jgi:hypothetical protein